MHIIFYLLWPQYAPIHVGFLLEKEDLPDESKEDITSANQANHTCLWKENYVKLKGLRVN